MSPILTNISGLLLFLVFAVLPAYYTNKYLLQLIRPKESTPRLLAHIIISLAAAVVYVSIVVIVLVRFVFDQ
jgi:hypothetical protein